jgi:hypothetical protein
MILFDITIILLKIVSLPHKSSNGTTYIMVFPYFSHWIFEEFT